MPANNELKMSEYNSLKEKSACFFPSNKYDDNCIQTADEFDKWFSYWEGFNTNRKYKVFFRGMGEAKHKLFSSAQRLWLSYGQAAKPGYQDFVMSLVNESLNSGTLLAKVFALYGIEGPRQEFPCLSILQHYGSPTSLLDWSYNFKVALFFAAEYASAPVANSANGLDDYFAVYAITEETYRVTEIEDKESVASCFPFPGEPVHPSHLYRLTDVKLDMNGICDPGDPFKKVLMATIYNQNIIPQEGLFIFNPYADIPMEDLFNQEYRNAPHVTEENVPNSSFVVYNIHKSLGEHVKSKIAAQGYTKDYIMPDLKTYASGIKEKVLKGWK